MAGKFSDNPVKGKKIDDLWLFLQNHPDLAGWIDGISASIDENRLTVSFLHKYLALWFQDHGRKKFEAAVKTYLATDKIDFFYACEDENYQARPAKSLKKRPPENLPRPDWFSTFMANDKNALPLAAAKDACQIKARNKAEDDFYPLLLLCGPSGTGKTHLLNAIYINLLYAGGSRYAFRTRAAIFCSRHAHNFGMTENFWQKHDVLLLDDLQNIAGRQSWTDWLATVMDIGKNAYARALADGRPVPQWNMVFAFSGSHSDIGQLDSRLACRLECGLVTELRQPDIDVRLRYLENANRLRRLGLGRDQIMSIAKNSLSLPQIRGILRKIEFFRKMHGDPPLSTDLDSLIGNGTPASALNPSAILALVSARFDIKPEEMLSPSRKPDRVLARQLAMCLCRDKLGLSYPELGRIFGGKDHSTVMHAIKKIRGLLQCDKDMHKLYTELESATR